MSEENNIEPQNNTENTNNKIQMDDKFKKSAETIVNKLFKDLNQLGDLAIKHRGNFSQKDIEAIFSAIKKKTTATKKNFVVTDENEDEFKL